MDDAAARRKGGDGTAGGRRSLCAVRALMARYVVFSRYTAGSILAGIVSESVLLATYGTGLLGPRAASVAGWAAGAVLNYGLNRWWAWGRRGRADLWRELLPYWAITLATVALSTWATGLADRAAPRLFASGSLRLAFVGAAFLTVYGVMFAVKFVLYHHVVFGARAGRWSPTGAGAGAAGPEPGAEAAGQEAGDGASGQEAGDGARPGDRRSRHQVPSTTRR